MTALKQLPAWQELETHQREIATDRIESYFDQDPTRADKFTIDLGSISLDYSKNHVRPRTVELLCDLARQRALKQSIEGMISGEIVNLTEEQPVLHMALRHSLDPNLTYQGESIREVVDSDRNEIYQCCEDISSGRMTGGSGKAFTDVVHIGIGGSALGPQVAVEALSHRKSTHPRVWFLHNMDARHFADVLARVELESTLFVIASKSFSTEETLVNAAAVKELLRNRELETSSHFIALTNKTQPAGEFGVSKVLPVRDWIPGRFSVWGPLALPVCLALGRDVYEEILSGARDMDQHFLNAPLDENMPVMLALLSVWYSNFWGAQTQAILPYAEHLRLLIPYLQQLETECNGKSVDRDGNRIDYDTSPIIWGGVGTTGQHAFYQLLHQGTRYVPSDFIQVDEIDPALGDPHGFHVRSKAHCIAQSRALMVGNRNTDSDGRPYPEHRYIEGNKPSNTIRLSTLNPQTLGSLIALYENKVTVQGFLWNINSFDQWGVELGKVLAREVLENLQSKK